MYLTLTGIKICLHEKKTGGKTMQSTLDINCKIGYSKTREMTYHTRNKPPGEIFDNEPKELEPSYIPKRQKVNNDTDVRPAALQNVKNDQNSNILGKTAPTKEFFQLLGDPKRIEFLHCDVRPWAHEFQPMQYCSVTEYLPHSEMVKISYSSKQANIDLFTGFCLENNRKKYVFNTGLSVWSLDWCPGIDDREMQYLAIGGYKQKDEHHVLGKRQLNVDNSIPIQSIDTDYTNTDLKNCIQIWNAGDLKDTCGKLTSMPPRLDLCICHEWGSVSDLKWMPYGGFESVFEFENDKSLLNSQKQLHIPRLGVLAATFGDGNLRIISIPHPLVIRNRYGMGEMQNPGKEDVLY
ncbi:General transcription factor 3C polypeptide 2, partial [Nowakowskiella sp. JEL0078]